MMASTRLRKTFRYPSESDSEPDELDEEHQEALLVDLKAQDDAKNDIYRKLYLAIPLLAALYFFTAIFTSTSARKRLLALLSLSSLVSTAYILHFLPIRTPGRKGKRPVYQVEAEKSPVERHILRLDAGLAGLIFLSALASWRRGATEDAWKEALPGSMSYIPVVNHFGAVTDLTREVIFLLTMFVRQQLAPVDLEELQKARYELKGA